MKIVDLFELVRLSRRLQKRPCPICRSEAGRPLLRYDRYLLPSNIKECERCGLIYCANMLSPPELERFYTSLYSALMDFKATEAQIATYQSVARERVTKISARLGHLDQLLEIGAGYGYFLAAARQAGARHLYGIEPSTSGVRHAQTSLHLGDQIVEAPFLEASPPPFAPQVTVLFHVLEHLVDPGAALDRLAAWIPEGASLVIEVPDTAADWSSMGLINFHISHASYFRAETLTDLLHRHGFAPFEVEREADGIYPGNLRVYARRDSSFSEIRPFLAPPSLASHVADLVKPWSLKNGYPRAVLRLLRHLARG
ncbi:class I SAM-dependent methyltransferase [Lacibacterium aquatile]|uniref:Class I SAM-dependent methyltransferase n=1 Tax=Lacibacterium aquatile TaxID=1168082 RepID=A0ABW5DUX1_9PROT